MITSKIKIKILPKRVIYVVLGSKGLKLFISYVILVLKDWKLSFLFEYRHY